MVLSAAAGSLDWAAPGTFNAVTTRAVKNDPAISTSAPSTQDSAFAQAASTGGLRAFWPALAWAAVIFGLSSVPGDRLPVVSISIADKIVHCGVYGLLGLLCCRGLTLTTRLRPLPALLVTMLLALAYGISDEIHQIFVPYRSPELLDVVADVIGGGVGAATALLLYRKARATKQRATPADSAHRR